MSATERERHRDRKPRIAVVGAGWTGATVARRLADRGLGVEVFEQADVVGGHARVETLNGVTYEPNGAHIFHTSDREVVEFLAPFGLGRPFEHRVLAEVFLHEGDEHGTLLSWPPQLGELRELSVWPQIERELGRLPVAPSGEDFESYALTLMGPTLYRLFIRDYTSKQWGRDPSSLSARFAPKRIDLRTDGYTRLFRDRWEYFPAQGANSVIESMLSDIAVTCGAKLSTKELEELGRHFDAVVVTAALDEFSHTPESLEWRGIQMRSAYTPVESPAATITPAYVVNRPSLRVPYTRTVETKHATGQQVAATVVSEEHPGADARHYPVPDLGGRNEQLNSKLMVEIQGQSPIRVWFCGRLATYRYINQDQAVGEGLRAAALISQELT